MPRLEQVEIDADRITNEASFHDIFNKAFGFPDFYGRNMNAWVDCMTSLDVPEDGLTKIHAPVDQPLKLIVKEASDFERRCPELLKTMLICAAFVNGRRMETDERPVLLVALVG
tara:strand:- start:18 stop:359 length:342 start_codon:yes stop_codon:yes gene_type:complete